ncbi:MAG: hypothetical protein FWG91_02960 [Lachnospiraceae bacterium]|nr:hypothetical protein [Lachnospiraceae bacterium]
MARNQNPADSGIYQDIFHEVQQIADNAFSRTLVFFDDTNLHDPFLTVQFSADSLTLLRLYCTDQGYEVEFLTPLFPLRQPGHREPTDRIVVANASELRTNAVYYDRIIECCHDALMRWPDL